MSEAYYDETQCHYDQGVPLSFSCDMDSYSFDIYAYTNMLVWNCPEIEITQYELETCPMEEGKHSEITGNVKIWNLEDEQCYHTHAFGEAMYVKFGCNGWNVGYTAFRDEDCTRCMDENCEQQELNNGECYYSNGEDYVERDDPRLI